MWSSGAATSRRDSRRGGRTTDRKSTRLNSSHGYISYAVFCLKKKKEKGENDCGGGLLVEALQKRSLLIDHHDDRRRGPLGIPTHLINDTRTEHACDWVIN